MRLIVFFLFISFAGCSGPDEAESAPIEPLLDSASVAEIESVSDSIEIGLKELEDEIETLNETIDSLLIGI